MRVVAFNCSPRKKGNTATMINVVLEELEVPCTPTSKGKVRVSDPYGPASDVSFKTFSIICDKAKSSAEE